ncbi:MAG: hypothetical protein ABL995_08135 [Bryobacteraceae bacterium]
MNRTVGFAVLLVLAGAIVFSAYLAVADAEFARGTPESVARAAQLRPGNTRYLMLRALHLDYDGADSTPLLEKIAVLNPMSSAPRIRLGLAAELRGDPVAAEHWLLSAARVDRQFEPSWTLANFYFRQNRVDDFWTAMRQALEVSYGDRTPAFELCWRMASEPGEVLNRVFSGEFAQKDDVASAYLHYLLDRYNASLSSTPKDPPETAAIEQAAVQLARFASKKDPQVLYAICDLLMDRARWQGAKMLWTSLGNAEPRGIFNGEFHEMPGAAKGHGFDWRWEPGEGVLHLPLDGSGHRVTLNGKQAEHVALLWQFATVEKGRKYELRWTTRTANLPSPAGLRWEVEGASAAIETSNDWKQQSVQMTAASNAVRVALVYQRPQGWARAEGWVDVQSIALTPAGETTSSPK